MLPVRAHHWPRAAAAPLASILGWPFTRLNIAAVMAHHLAPAGTARKEHGGASKHLAAAAPHLTRQRRSVPSPRSGWFGASRSVLYLRQKPVKRGDAHRNNQANGGRGGRKKDARVTGDILRRTWHHAGRVILLRLSHRSRRNTVHALSPAGTEKISLGWPHHHTRKARHCRALPPTPLPERATARTRKISGAGRKGCTAPWEDVLWYTPVHGILPAPSRRYHWSCFPLRAPLSCPRCWQC